MKPVTALKDDLTLVLRDYERVSKAPKYETLIAMAKRDGIPESQAFTHEWHKRYKAIQSGKVYLMQNPALMTWQYEMGRKIHRVTPEFKGFYKELLKAESKKADGPLKSSRIPDDPIFPDGAPTEETQRKLNL
jgi:hypothetical protein